MATDGKHQNLPSTSRNNYNLELMKDEVLVKWSEFNTSTCKMLSEFHRECPNCIFARVMRVGPEIVDKVKLTPGKIVVIQKGVGEKLEGLSLIERCDYIIIHEKDVIYYGTLN